MASQDELGSFIFRTTGYNSVRTLAARLRYFEAVSGQATRYLPLLLRLRAKSTTLSHRTPVYYVDLTLRDDSTLAQSVQAADRRLNVSKKPVSIPRHWKPWRALLGNGQFEETEEDIPQMLEEFYPEAETENPPAQTATWHHLQQLRLNPNPPCTHPSVPTDQQAGLRFTTQHHNHRLARLTPHRSLNGIHGSRAPLIRETLGPFSIY